MLRAPHGKEVEECTPLEISEILKDAFSPEVSSVQQPIYSPHQAPHHQQRHNYDRRNYRREREPQEDYRAPHLGQQEALQPRGPSKEALVEDSVEILSAVRDVYPQINETLEAVVLDGSMNTLLKVPVSEVIKRLNSAEGGNSLVIDGIVTQRLVDAADKAGMSTLWDIGRQT